MNKKLVLTCLTLLILAGALLASDSLGKAARSRTEQGYFAKESYGVQPYTTIEPYGAAKSAGGNQLAGEGQPASLTPEESSLRIPCLHYDEPSFQDAVMSAMAYQGGIEGLKGGVVPHHLLASRMIASFWRTAAQEAYDAIVIFGPDHQRKGHTPITTVTIPFATRRGDVMVLKSAADRLMQENIASEDLFTMEQDHAVSCQMPFIRYYMPNTPVLPILLYGNCSPGELEKLSRCLQDELAGQKILYVASMDFSHYLSLEEADKKDLVTEEAFRCFDLDAIRQMNNDYLDSRSSAQLLLMTMAELEAGSLETWDHSNSDIIGKTRTGVTTSYFAFGFFKSDQAGNEMAPQTGMEMKEIKLAAVGDIMLGRDVERRLAPFGYDYFHPFEAVSGFLGEGDIVFGNLEHPLTSREKSLDRNRKYILRGRTEAVSGIQRAGFNLLSLANNHIMDYYGDGLIDTMALLSSHGLAFAGAGKDLAAARSPAILEKNGCRVGLLAYTDMAGTYYEGNPSIRFAADEQSPGVAPIKPEWMLEDIRKVRDDVDLLIVSLHWGVEDSFGIAPEQKQLARRLMDEGADVILGHHPHWFQGIELYQGKPIVYSLGNFVFDQHAAESKEAFILLMDFSQGVLTALEAVPVRCEDKRRVVPQTGASADAMLIRQIQLCEELNTSCERAGDRLIFEIP